MGGLQIPRWLGSDPLSAWWLGLAPATLEFWARFPNERNQGKQALPVLKYRVPHGSQCVMSRLIHTGLGSSSDDDDPFIVLTETKFSFRCIPVWIGTLLTGLGSKKRTHVIMFSP